MRSSPLRVPGEEGAVLSVPPRSQWSDLLAENLVERDRVLIFGEPVEAIRRRARRETLSLAEEYSRQFQEPSPSAAAKDATWLVAGHQPELFHAGVWIKNVALARWGAELGSDTGKAVSLNLLADTDTVRRATLATPGGKPSAPFLAHIPFDRPGEEIPYEERRVVDDRAFEGFADEVMRTMKEYPFSPMIRHYWDAVREAKASSDRLGEVLAAGRRTLERGAGLFNRELPVSWLARTRSFRQFLASCLLDATSLASAHNQTLSDYRARNRVRSRSHPVAALETSSDGRIESPFWTWVPSEPRRRRLFVRRDAKGLELFADDRSIARLPAEREPLADALENLSDSRKIRPRALTLTLFARLAIADVFIHGVGGGKYDELTDAIAREWLGVDLGRYVILSGTFRLPVGQVGLGVDSLRRIDQRRRDGFWNPDRYLDDSLREQEPIASWIEAKHELFEDEPPTRVARQARYAEFRRLNDELRKYLRASDQSLIEERDRVADEVVSSQILQSREFAFCLHPLELLERLTCAVGASVPLSRRR